MSEFDWVEARYNCTVDKAFAALKEAVRSDCDRYRGLSPGAAKCLEYGVCGEGEKFFVKRAGSHMVVFENAGRTIQIERWSKAGEHISTLKLSVHLDDDGNCALTDKGDAILKLWQVRRKALEETLFGSK